MKTYAFIDSQNLNLGTSKDIIKKGKVIYKGWPLDFKKLLDEALAPIKQRQDSHSAALISIESKLKEFKFCYILPLYDE